MAWVSIDLPDEMAEWVREAELDVSAIAQAALTAELNRRATSAWLASLPIGENKVPHEAVMRALDEAKAEMYGDDASIYDHNE